MPVVYFTDGECESVDHLVKKEWGVIAIRDEKKNSYPWHMVERVYEKIERSCEDSMVVAEEDTEVWG